MGQGCSHVSDMGSGVCPAHSPSPLSYTTLFVSGAPETLVNGQEGAIISTLGISSCGHATVAISGSTTCLMTGEGAHRLGDLGTNPGSYVTITGSANVLIGG